jgi:hypothetical protein
MGSRRFKRAAPPDPPPILPTLWGGRGGLPAPLTGRGSGFSWLLADTLQPNGRFQPLPEAGATEERTLEAVGWKPVLAALSTEPVEWQHILLTMISIGRP